MPQAILLRALQACCLHAEGKGSCGFGFGEVLTVGSVKLTVPVVSGNRIILLALKMKGGKEEEDLTWSCLKAGWVVTIELIWLYF